MSAALNHAFYAVVRPHDCLCTMCLGPCRDCGRPAIVPIKARTRKGYVPCCGKCAVVRARKIKRGGR